MPRSKNSVRYKELKKRENTDKIRTYQTAYRKSRREQWNHSQKMLMRSRLARFNNNEATSSQIRKHRRLNSERFSKHVQSVGEEEINQRRKQARKRWNKCVDTFEKEIRDFHTHTCTCCGKLYRFSQLKILNKSFLASRNYDNDFLKNIFWVTDTSEAKFCTSCAKDINKKKIPKLALCNGLDFPKVPDCIKQLNRIEERLLAPRHIFQTIWSVKGPTGQYKTKGGIVNIPVEVDNSVSSIPRPINNSSMIHVRIARKMEYLKDYMSGVVWTQLLYDAAKEFVKTPLAIGENITLSEAWNSNFDDNHEALDIEDEFYNTNAIHETLLMQNENNFAFSGLTDTSIRIAPAQGFRPTSILFDEKCEYLAFPTVFGGHKMDPMHNGKPISYTDLITSCSYVNLAE
ncbi:Exodeoxyribonuclease 7 large subunit [Frankliniella fusca]|uniref:Exodeoxyribonuclease 7 large subunit n=1 Tax=Frankliniella fusca TaxID=407009 RepID=A0AAE1GT68_9NEOP|nr:Exodeoxyribonuclease 7 large subunit [Frankliniella fusca]